MLTRTWAADRNTGHWEVCSTGGAKASSEVVVGADEGETPAVAASFIEVKIKVLLTGFQTTKKMSDKAKVVDVKTHMASLQSKLSLSFFTFCILSTI
jgi:hypothetical protein